MILNTFGRCKDWFKSHLSKPWTRVAFAFCVIGLPLSFLPAVLSNINRSFKSSTDGFTFDQANDTLTLYGSIQDFNFADPSKVTVVWKVFPNGIYASNDTLYPSVPIDIYMNNVTTAVWSYDINATLTGPGNNTAPLSSELFIFQLDYQIPFAERTLVPFDSYEFWVTVFAIDKQKNTSIAFDEIQISNNGPGYFRTDPFYYFDTPTDATYNFGGQPVTVRTYSTSVDIYRSNSARTLTLFMFIINWILVVCSVFTTTLFFNPKYKTGESIALLPITAILTIPAIRALYVGSPPYGIFLDVIGFFPQMVLVVMTMITVMIGLILGPKLKREPGGGKQDEEEGDAEGLAKTLGRIGYTMDSTENAMERMVNMMDKLAKIMDRMGNTTDRTADRSEGKA